MIGHGCAAEARVGLGRCGEHGQLLDGLVRIARERRGEQARAGQLGGEQSALGSLIETGIGAFSPGGAEQLGYDPLQHVRALAQVDRRQVKAEHLGRAQQRTQARAREPGRTVRHQRIVDGGQLVRKLVRIGIGRRGANFVPRHFKPAQGACAGGEARIDA